jgi:hypothetical protein
MKIRADRLQRGNRAYLDGLEAVYVRCVAKMSSGKIWIAYEDPDDDNGHVVCAPEQLVRLEVLQ